MFWQALIEAYPEAASIENDHGDLPLHILLQNGGVGNVPSEVATKIFDANPEAIRKTDSLGRYPLHAALLKVRMDAFIQRALEHELEGQSPAAVLSPDGDLPLHLALENECIPETVRAIVKSFPEGIIRRRDDGTNNLSTLYISCSRKLKLKPRRIEELCEILDIFFEEMPDLVTDPELSDPRQKKRTELPLHIALNSRSVDAVVTHTVKATHQAGILQEVLLKEFNKPHRDTPGDLPFCLMLEQNRGFDLIMTCVDLCDGKTLIETKNPEGQLPVEVVLDHCTRSQVASFVLSENTKHNKAHQITDAQKLFLAARTNDIREIENFVKNDNVDFNTQNDKGMTAKEVANFYGYAKLAAMLPDAARAALSKDALIAQAKDAKGQTVAKAKFHLAPFIAIAGFFVHYLDIYTDFALMMKFGNIHFPYLGAEVISGSPHGMNVQCAKMDEDYEFACSEYKEPNFFNLSIIFLVMGVIATCIVDYFMMHTTSSLPFLLTHFLMNILFVRMAYEVCQAIVNRARNRMPQAGLSAVKAAEGLFESVPQLLLQGFILFRLVLEPLRRPGANNLALRL